MVNIIIAEAFFGFACYAIGAAHAPMLRVLRRRAVRLLARIARRLAGAPVVVAPVSPERRGSVLTQRIYPATRAR